MVFSNIFASDKLTSVFGGNGKVSMTAANIVRADKNVPVFDEDLTVEKMDTDAF